MPTHVQRSIDEPIRDGLSWDELWRGPDQGLICCWEGGRKRRIQDPELGARAEEGQLVVLAWAGGVEKKLKLERKPGSLNYLATWQGLRGEDLDIVLEAEQVVICSRTGQAVAFCADFAELATEVE